jgi:hypothetical protein
LVEPGGVLDEDLRWLSWAMKYREASVESTIKESQCW